MNEKEAMQVLRQAVLIGQQHGIYSLRDASLIFNALSVLDPEFEASINAQPMRDKEQEKEKQDA